MDHKSEAWIMKCKLPMGVRGKEVDAVDLTLLFFFSSMCYILHPIYEKVAIALVVAPGCRIVCTCCEGGCGFPTPAPHPVVQDSSFSGVQVFMCTSFARTRHLVFRRIGIGSSTFFFSCS